MCNTEHPITTAMIAEGIKRGIISFIIDPNMAAGTVCKIGEYWFYFGGQSAEQESPAEFLSNSNLSDVIDTIQAVLAEMGADPESETEYMYYHAYLMENI